MSDLVVEPWTNEFGQTINPGDEVIYAGTSWKRTTMRKGIFAGVRYGDVTKTRYLTDEQGRYIKEEVIGRNGEPAGWYRNKSVTETTRQVVSVRVDKVNRGSKWGYVDGKYQKLDDVHYGTATLPLMRVYKLNTSLNDLAGHSF